MLENLPLSLGNASCGEGQLVVEDSQCYLFSTQVLEHRPATLDLC